MLVFVDLEKAFESLPKDAIINRLIDLGCSWQMVKDSVKSLMDTPVGKLRGTKDYFEMKRGVRQGSKEGPLLFNLTFQLILDEALSSLNDCAVRMIDHSG